MSKSYKRSVDVVTKKKSQVSIVEKSDHSVLVISIDLPVVLNYPLH
jgi:hypothetical protein